MVDDPPSTKWTTSTRAKLPRGLPFSYRNELHCVPARVWLGKRREYVRRACTSSLRARPPPTWVYGRDYRDTNLDIMRRPSPCLRPVRPPVTTTPHSSSPYLSSFIFSMTFSRYQFSDKILEISLVFTHGITPAWVNHNMCFVKKCILMFRAMHEHLACTYITQITSRKEKGSGLWSNVFTTISKETECNN